jgi:hypothetical protein
MQVGLPECSKPAHSGSGVTLYDRYGPKDARRQRYRCYPADGTRPHTFAGDLARMIVAEGTCASCENHIDAHQGLRLARPASRRHFEAAT